MRNLTCILLLILTVLMVRAYGNIIIVRHSPVKVCVKIENLKDYPDIVLIGLSDCFALFPKPEVEIVDSTLCLEVSKACPLTFYAVKKDYLEKNGIENINWEDDKNVKKSNKTVNARTTYIDYPDVETLEINFIIAGFNEKSMVMYQTSRTFKFSNNKPDVVVEGFYPGLESLQKSFKLQKTF